MPVYPTIASRFNDPGVNRLFAALAHALGSRKVGSASWQVPEGPIADTAAPPALIPGARIRYLAEIAQGGRAEKAHIEKKALAASRAYGLHQALASLNDGALPTPFERVAAAVVQDEGADQTRRQLYAAYNAALDEVGAQALPELAAWPARVAAATAETCTYPVRGRAVTAQRTTLKA